MKEKTKLRTRLDSRVWLNLGYKTLFFFNCQSYGIKECSPELNGDYRTNLIDGEDNQTTNELTVQG